MCRNPLLMTNTSNSQWGQITPTPATEIGLFLKILYHPVNLFLYAKSHPNFVAINLIEANLN